MSEEKSSNDAAFDVYKDVNNACHGLVTQIRHLMDNSAGIPHDTNIDIDTAGIRLHVTVRGGVSLRPGIGGLTTIEDLTRENLRGAFPETAGNAAGDTPPRETKEPTPTFKPSEPVSDIVDELANESSPPPDTEPDTEVPETPEAPTKSKRPNKAEKLETLKEEIRQFCEGHPVRRTAVSNHVQSLGVLNVNQLKVTQFSSVSGFMADYIAAENEVDDVSDAETTTDAPPAETSTTEAAATTAEDTEDDEFDAAFFANGGNAGDSEPSGGDAFAGLDSAQGDDGFGDDPFAGIG